MNQKMKLAHMVGALLCVGVASTAHAQSSVTLYGLLDTGIDFANNVDGSHLYQMASGVSAGSRWGVRGKEDLGGGLSAVFDLESGFNSTNGSLGSGLAFSRNAYVGLASQTAGTVTLGRQWDPIVDLIEPFSLNDSYGGWYFSHPNDMDNLDNGFAISNAVKYTSPTIGGFTGEALYSFGGQAGQFSNNSAYSAAASYSNGPFSMGAGYLRVNDPEQSIQSYQNGSGFTNAVYGDYLANARSQGIFAAGASYSVGKFKVMGNFTNVNFQQGDDGQDVKFQNYEIAGTFQATSQVNLAAGYTYTEGRNHATGQEPKYQQLNLSAEYEVSKRTAVYALAALQRASGGAVAQIAGFDPSTTGEQVVGRVGIRHSF
ncbi:porin [Paraburkholderia metrosideri]|jgi:predicted porin|uniref:Outer membrane porin protein n=1 Tax=Paraburkholderia metrosideri TaxID=580937 RepID=A0ABM8N892_9BURK|nr:porin [Paraburkholderia metrosideri]CAD6507458.1 Outer membrane porin protein [Paraburkholderia metrosideri]